MRISVDYPFRDINLASVDVSCRTFGFGGGVWRPRAAPALLARLVLQLTSRQRH